MQQRTRRASPRLSRRAAAATATAFATSLATLTAAAQAPAAGAAATPGTPDLSVIVTASRGSTTLDQMPLYTTVVTREDIDRSPAQTLDQLLRQIPGINLSGQPYFTSDPTGNQAKMRGVSNAKVLVLLDGIPILDPFYTTVQWFKVPLSSVERVEVIRGGNSSLWGNLAVAGVINIVSRKPVDARGEVSASYGSMQTWNGAIAKDFVVDERFSLRLSADILDTDGYQTTPEPFLSTVPGKGTSSATNANVRMQAYFKPRADLSGFFRAGWHRQDQDIGGYTYGTNLQKSPDAAGGLTWSIDERTRLVATAWWQRVNFDKYNGAACYLQSASNCNTTSTTSPLVQFYNSHDDNPYRELGGSAILSQDGRGMLRSVQLGVDFRRIGGEDSAQTYNRPTTTDVASATINRTNYGQGRQQFAGVFAQARFVPLDALELTGAARYDYWRNYDGIARMNRYANGVPGTDIGGPVPDSHKGSFNPSLAFRFAASDALDLRGAAYKSFRAPGLNNLYRSFSSTTSITIANPTLKPETLTGGELGADWRTRRFSLSATAFIYDIKDLIASFRVANAAVAPPAVIDICGPTLSNCPASVSFNTNAQDGRSWGVELASRWTPSADVTVDASYVRTTSTFTRSSVGDPTGVQLGAIPKDVVWAGVTWQTLPRWRNYAEIRFTGKMYLDVAHTIPQPEFAVVNLASSWQVDPRLELYASAVNLFDKHYSDNATTTASGANLGQPRTFTAGFRWRF